MKAIVLCLNAQGRWYRAKLPTKAQDLIHSVDSGENRNWLEPQIFELRAYAI